MSCEKHKAGLAVDFIKLEQTPIEKAIWSVLDEYCDAENHPLKEYDLVCDVLQKVEEAVSKCTFTGWIPVSERLPDKNGSYLVSFKEAITNSDGLCVKYWSGEEQRWRPCNYAPSVCWRAWMPLPEPYKEDKE